MKQEESLAVRIAYSLLKLTVILLNTVITVVVLYWLAWGAAIRFGPLPNTREVRNELAFYWVIAVIPLYGFVTVMNLLPLLFKAMMAGKGLLRYVIERVPDEVIYNCEGLAGRHYSDKLSKYLSKAQEEYGIGKDEIRVLRIWYSYFWEIQHKKQYHKGNGKERKEETLQPIQWDEETNEVLSWREKEEEEERERNKSPIPEEIA